MEETETTEFPHAPAQWSPDAARAIAAKSNLELTADHWEAIAGLQDYFSRHGFGKRRELSDALEEKFHHKGGMKYLYQLFPGGPVAQGCVIAGLEPPPGSVDRSFGSVV